MMRLLRGRVLVREDLKADTDHFLRIIVPDVFTTHDKDAVAVARTWHRGTVIQIGPPALTKKGVEVPHGFAVGDVVLFHWAHAERMWSLDLGEGVVVALPQDCVDVVLEPAPEAT
jgi:co-chaperonin GroES (HSP10)